MTTKGFFPVVVSAVFWFPISCLTYEGCSETNETAFIKQKQRQLKLWNLVTGVPVPLTCFLPFYFALVMTLQVTNAWPILTSRVTRNFARVVGWSWSAVAAATVILFTTNWVVSTTQLNLLCCRPRRTKYFFTLVQTRSRRKVFLAFLLLIAGVESNPGPRNTSSSTTNFGLINARSMIQKTTLIHDVISVNRLDLLAMTETWVCENSPDVHKSNAAPAGFSIVHAHRRITPHTRGKQHGGGVAFIHREDIRVRVIPTPSTRPFEILLVKVINCTIGLTIAVIYRPPSTKLNRLCHRALRPVRQWFPRSPVHHLWRVKLSGP